MGGGKKGRKRKQADRRKETAQTIAKLKNLRADTKQFYETTIETCESNDKVLARRLWMLRKVEEMEEEERSKLLERIMERMERNKEILEESREKLKDLQEGRWCRRLIFIRQICVTCLLKVSEYTSSSNDAAR
ncbi:hypothetical protein HK104_003059 [Borealophlyctis nickersoniae]|nr:hypothetical protein HK104_003059 [Borealophlyctis nickersoniae]